MTSRTPQIKHAASDFADTTTLYFLQTPEEEETAPNLPPTIIEDTGPIYQAPEHWIRDYFLVDNAPKEDIPVYYYVARAKKERGVIVGCSGLKSDIPLNAKSVEAYNQAGISVIIMALPNPERTVGFMWFFQKVFEQFTLREDSPAHTLFHKDLPKFLYGHSTGGQILTRFLTNPKNTESIQNKYVSALAEAPFFDTANASMYSPSALRIAFETYARWNRDSLPKETLGGLYYLHYNTDIASLQSRLPKKYGLTALPLKTVFALNTAAKTVRDLYLSKYTQGKKTWFQREGSTTIPTYGQISEVQNKGRKFIKRVEEDKLASSIPLTIVATEEDPFSCFQTIQNKVAPPLNADFYVANGQHTPLNEDATALELSIQKIKPYLLKTPPADALPSPNETTKPERWSIKTLGNRFGRAFQGSTRFLNPVTSFFKRLG